MNSRARKATPIAIVGMASHFPDSTSLYDFWTNITTKKDSITENLGWDGYWKKEDFYGPNSSDKDKTYAYKAGWIPPIDFDPVEFKLPPLLLDSISTAQLFALYVAKSALTDARIIGSDTCLVDKERVGVILGGAGNGNTSFSLAARQQAPYLTEIMKNSGLPDYVAEDIIERLMDQYLEWNEDSFPGFLGNVACGRITSYFDLGGTSNMVDAACASSLAAIKASIAELADGSCDAMLTGGVNLENSIFSFLCFSRTPALSPSNSSRPFDKKSDGMMLGDGVGLLVLKRLEDAERHGDRIYGVIKSISGSSDGRAKSIFAPRFEGQVRAINRAYEAAGVTPADIGLIEAHGTGTVSGDQTEIKSLKHVYGDHDIVPRSIALGSIKSQIGHTRCAAGAASLIKVALGLHHKVLPPTINVETPNKELASDSSLFYVNSAARPWIRWDSEKVRTAAVSAFGFGGTNYHLVVEEYLAEHKEAYRLLDTADVFILVADTPSDLLTSCKDFLGRLQADNGTTEYHRHLLQQQSVTIGLEQARLGFAAKGIEETTHLMAAAVAQLEKEIEQSWDHPLGIYYKPCASCPIGRVVALFPGQGSQYVGMAQDVANEFPEMREAFSGFDKARVEAGMPLLSTIVYPPSSYDEAMKQTQKTELTSTDNAQPAIGAVALGYYKILTTLGLNIDFVAGHSYGELVALYVAGVIDETTLHRLSIARGHAMKGAAQADKDAGAMLAVALDESRVARYIEDYDDVLIANYNSDNQVVLGGGTESIQNLHSQFKNDDIRCSKLPVSAAFHTPFVYHASEPFDRELKKAQVSTPVKNVYSNITGNLYPDEPESIKEVLGNQMVNPVKFKQVIENIYRDGGNCFVEIGPKGALSKLASEILGDKPHTTISVDPSENIESSGALRKCWAKLIVEGISLSNIDPYKIQRPEPEIKGQLTFRMNGGFFFSELGKERRSRGKRVDTRLIKRFIKEKSVEATSPVKAKRKSEVEPTPIHHSRGRSASMDVSNKEQRVTPNILSEQVQAQNQINAVHQQFQENQKDYIGFLNGLMQQQFSLFDKHHASENFDDMVTSLNHSFQLLDKNQSLYHTNHERYFLNQYALMNGELTEPAINPGRVGSSAVLENKRVEQPLQQEVARFNPERPEDGLSVPVPELPSVPVSSAESKTPQVSPVSVVRTDVEQPEPIEVKTTKMASEVSLSAKDKDALDQFRGLTEEAMTGELIKIISDKTGYPTDMIGADMDLEGDLGIDSIKRIEIIGAMFDSFSADMKMDYDAEDYSELDTIDVDQFSTINKMVSYLMGYVKEIIEHLEKGGSLEELEQKAKEGNSESSNQEKTTDNAVAEGRNTESEAKEVDEGVATVMREIGFVVTSNDAEVASESPKPEPVDSASLTNETAGSQSVENTEERQQLAINRYGVRTKELPIPDSRQLKLADGFVWVIVADNRGISVKVAESLAELGHKIALIGLKKATIQTKHEYIRHYSLPDSSEKSISSILDKIRINSGRVGAFIGVQGDESKYKTITTCFPKKHYQAALAVFLFAKHIGEDINGAARQGDALFYVISQLDGQLGIQHGGGYSPISGSITGLAKSLNYEWPQVHCRAIDIKPKTEVAVAARCILQEVFDPRSDLIEIGRENERHRVTLTLSEERLKTNSPLEISKEDIVLVSGGARGITAACITELAKRKPAHYILLGRTSITDEIPAWADGLEDVKSLRAAAVQHMRDNKLTLKPSEIEALVNSVLNAINVKNTLKKIGATGSVTSYVGVDILNKKELSTALKNIQKKHGSISALIHGAGNIADKKIEKKTVVDFEQVYETKIKGLENIIQALDLSKLKLLALFSSVSGYFGNAGQTDYSMANESLNKFAHLCLTYYPELRVKAIDWGPWDSGMVNDSLKKAYRDRGIAIIDQSEGARIFADEVDEGTEVQVIIGNSVYQQTRPLISIEERAYGRRLSPKDNPFLVDHVIDGSPVLPATCAINWMVEIAECILPGYRLLSIERFKVLKGIIFYNDDSQNYSIEVVRSNTSSKTQDSRYLDLTIYNGHNGNRVNRYTCTVAMALDSAKSQVIIDIPTREDGSLADKGWSLYQSSDGKRPLLFHGESFQGIEKVILADDRSVVAKCCLADTRHKHGQFQINSFNPYVADVAIQAPYLWLPMMTEYAGLPLEIASIEHYLPIRCDETFYVKSNIVKLSSTQLTADIYVANADGSLAMKFGAVSLSISKGLKTKLITESVDNVGL